MPISRTCLRAFSHDHRKPVVVAGNETKSVKKRRTAMGTTSSSPMDFAVRLIHPVVFAVACPSAKNVHKTNTYVNIEVPLSS